MYEKLTKYAGALAGRDLGSHLGCGTLGMEDFADDFCGLHDDDLDDLGFADCHYYATLEHYSVDDSDGIAGCDIEHANAELVLACSAASQTGVNRGRTPVHALPCLLSAKLCSSTASCWIGEEWPINLPGVLSTVGMDLLAQCRYCYVISKVAPRTNGCPKGLRPPWALATSPLGRYATRPLGGPPRR